MQVKYQPNFATLTNEEADYFADAISGAVETNVVSGISEVTGEALYQKLCESNVDHKTAVMALANDPSPVAVTILEKVAGMAVIAKANKAPANVKAAREKAKAEGKPAPKLLKNDPRTIHNIKPDAKRPGSASYTRYQLYQEGMTVTEFIAAGGTAGDVKHDVSKGFIELRDV